MFIKLVSSISHLTKLISVPLTVKNRGQSQTIIVINLLNVLTLRCHVVAVNCVCDVTRIAAAPAVAKSGSFLWQKREQRNCELLLALRVRQALAFE